MDHLQVPCLRHGLPLCVFASNILSYALSVETKSEFLQIAVILFVQYDHNSISRVTLPVLVIWQSSQVPWQRLYLVWIGRSIWVRPRCFKMSALVPQPGLTMSRSILPPGTASNLIWWVNCEKINLPTLTVPHLQQKDLFLLHRRLEFF